MNKKLKTLLVSLAVLALVGVSAACFAILPKANMKPSDYESWRYLCPGITGR